MCSILFGMFGVVWGYKRLQTIAAAKQPVENRALPQQRSQPAWSEVDKHRSAVQQSSD
jgi:hypothetical protein